MPLFDFARCEFVSEPDAKVLIDPVSADICGVWDSSISMWNTVDEEPRRRISETAIAPAFNLNVLAQSFAKEVFSNRESEGIEICDAIPGVIGIYIQQRVLIRFNAVGKHYAVLNIDKSDLKRKYFHQQPIRYLNNDATRLTAYYRLDESKTALSTVGISMQLGETCVYHFEIDPEHGALAVTTIEPAPLPPPPSNIQRKKPK